MQAQNSFYNTVPISGIDLSQAEKNAKGQEALVLEVYRKYPQNQFTPFEMLELIGINYPVTSIRRALTNLTSKGLLIKTEAKRKGKYGMVNNTWRLAGYTKIGLQND